MDVEGVEPSDIAFLFNDENIFNQKDWCKNCISCEKILEDKYCNIYRTVLDCEFLSSREFVDKKYCKYDPETDSYYVIFVTANDHPEVMSDFAEEESLVRGRNYLASYILRPLEDGRKGTQFLCISQSDFGGSVPTWLVNRFAPKPLSKFMLEIIKAAQK